MFYLIKILFFVYQGCPCESIRLEITSSFFDDDIDLDAIWKKLVTMKRKRYIMGSCCGRTDMTDNKFLNSLGLMWRRYYIIKNIKEIKEERIIQLKNPFNRPVTWQGDWSKGSSKWTHETRELLRNELIKDNFERKQNQKKGINMDADYFEDDIKGVFWMPFKEFTQYFHSIDICKIGEDWLEKRITDQFNIDEAKSNGLKLYRLTLFEKSQMHFSLFHCKIKNNESENDPDLGILVTKAVGGKDTNGDLVFTSKHLVRKFISTEHTFEPGEYYLIPISFNSWFKHDLITIDDVLTKKNFYDSFNLVINSLNEFFCNEETHSQCILADTIIRLCMKRGTKADTGLENTSVYTLKKGFSGIVFFFSFQK